MTAYVFVGPSLAVARAREVLDAVYLPPVAQGDIHRVLRRRPSLIGIVDGYFECVPAVWHKEILCALDQGVPVLGSASMGALRAAELDTFGMQGVGRVYEAYRDGVLEDDDEVAVAHAPAEHGYRPLSEAMVSIRPTLDLAAEAEVVGDPTRRTVLAAAKNLFYADRTYPAALAAAARAGADPGELNRLRRWLHGGAVDQKAEDAVALLEAMRKRLAEGDTTVIARFSFERTDFWYEAQRSAGDLRVDPADDTGSDSAPPTTTAEMLLDELRLQPDRHEREWAAALARVNALDQARRAGVEVGDAELQATADTFRRERGLLSATHARAWRAANDLTHEQTRQLLRQEAQVQWVRSSAALPVAEVLPDQLRVSGAYPRIAGRARDKARRLEQAGLERVSLADLGVSWDEVLRWYFRERLDRAVPDAPGAFAAANGYTNEGHFRRVLLREYAYATLVARSDAKDAPAEHPDRHTAEHLPR